MKIKPVLISLLLLLYATTTHAAELTLVPSVGFGESYLTFSRSTGEVDQSRFNIVDLGMTASYGNYYLKINTEMPLGEAYVTGPSTIRQFKREDFGATAGYYVNDKLSLFGGYAYGKTSIVTTTSGSTVYTEHQDAGPYIGANYSLFLGKTGTLGLNVAYADESGILIVNNIGGSGTTQSGKTSGYSVGAIWTDVYKNKLTYYLGYKWKRYKTELPSSSINKTFDIFTFGFIFPI